ncbi:MAG TPA: helix-turn-helix transcriptional regulator [Nocardioides sp.]
MQAADTLADDAPAVDPALAGVRLTPRERDVLALVALGASNARIGEELGLTLHTVKGYVKNVMAKTGAATRLEAAVLARRAGLLA